MVANGRLKDAEKIGVRVGKVVDKYKMSKHMELDIQDGQFSFQINAAKVAEQAALDGLYVIRTALPREQLSTGDSVGVSAAVHPRRSGPYERGCGGILSSRQNPRNTAQSARACCLTRTNVALRLALAVQAAIRLHTGEGKRQISPHVIRHTTAISCRPASTSA